MTITALYAKNVEMGEGETLRNPPIVEAMLDVRVVFPKGVELARLAALHEQFLLEYPKMEEVRVVQFNFQGHVGQPPTAPIFNQGVQGYRFFSADAKQIIQCLQHGLVFNRLAPYGSWEDFIAVARRAWECYRTAFTGAQITRIGVRYINRILVPTPDGRAELNDYFTVNLPGPRDHPFAYDNFMEHSLFRDAQTGLGINWVFARQPPMDATAVPIILDIDVHALGLMAQQHNPVEMWETMRKLKNRLFFSSFTQKGLDLFR